jgi:hypothetical protein
MTAPPLHQSRDASGGNKNDSTSSHSGGIGGVTVVAAELVVRVAVATTVLTMVIIKVKSLYIP